MTRRLFLLVVALGVYCGVAEEASRLLAQSVQGDQAVELLASVEPAVVLPDAASLARFDTLAARLVTVNTAALSAGAMRIETFGTPYVARLSRLDGHANGAVVWNGVVPDEPLSSVTIAQLGPIVHGSIRFLDAAYAIEPVGDSGLAVLRQIDVSSYGAEIEPLLAPALFEPATDPAPPTDDGSTFDVLVVYTPAAKTRAGGTDAAVQARIALGVSETNTAYQNSGMVPRLRLVGAEAIAYTEDPADMSTDLQRLTSTSDGFMDQVHLRRNTLGADLVQLVVGAAAGGACGIAWLMEPPNSGAFAPYAFSVTAYDCISPNYTFAHELGHNMGSNHAPDDPVTPTPLYPYSFGYKHPSNLFRTVMAYACTGGCPRILHFSNPAVGYNGAPTGTAAQHNNALSINNARVIVANWRQSVPSGGGPSISPIANQSTNEDSPTPAIPFTITDPDTPLGNLTVTASSSNATLVPNTPSALALGGSGGSRTLTITPSANESGTSTITVTVSDGTAQAFSAFTLSVAAANDPPALWAVPASASVPQNTGAQTVVTVSDIDSSGVVLSLAASSGNPTLLPDGNIALTPVSVDTNSRIYQVVMTPAPGQQGVAIVTLSAFDGAGTGTLPFTLTVTPPGSAPVISPIALQVMDEDAVLTVPFTVSDADTPAGALTVDAASSNPTLVDPTGLVTSGASGARSLTVRPNANQAGSAIITVTASDGVNSSQTTFPLTVTAMNDPPAFGPATPTSVTMLASTSVSVEVTVTDIDSSGGTLSLSGASATPVLLPDSGIEIAAVSSTAFSRTFIVSLTPEAGAVGSARVVLTATDGQPNASVTRDLAVVLATTLPAPNPPTDTSATASGLGVAVGWLPATTGARATTYLVEIGTAPGTTTLPTQTVTAPATSLVVSLPDGTYFVRVRAVNASGASGPSPEASVSVGSASQVPMPPINFALTTSGVSATFTWAPAAAGPQPTGYRIEAGTAAGLADIAVIDTGTVPWLSVPVVPPGTYFVRVRGRNTAGLGAASQEISFVMGSTGRCIAQPGPPVLLTPVVAGNNVTLAWNASTAGGAADAFVLAAGATSGASEFVFDTGSPATSLTASAPDGIYFVRLAARNACGIGPVSNEVSFTVGPRLPGAPSGLVASVTGGVVTLTWIAPATGDAPTAYLIEVGSQPGQANLVVFSTGSTTPSFRAAAPPGTYYVRVRGLTSAGPGPASNEVTVTVP
jgi:hypothetical protein